MKTRPINFKDYQTLLELDKKVYPTDSPVTPGILDSWYKKNPEFGIIFENSKGLGGMCIAIPLTKNGWTSLISGELAESELNEETIFDNNRDNELGIHIYHIEKFNSSTKFYDDSLKGLSKIVSNLKESNPELKVVGFSALCVTAQGIGLFYNKFNCRERNFINSEHILDRNGQILILDSESNEEIEEKISQGYNYRNRCKMLVTCPEEISLVWKYF